MTTEGIARREGDELALLEAGGATIQSAIEDESVDALSHASERRRISLTDAVLLPPLQPPRVVIVGLNYRSHVDETGQPLPEAVLFAVGDSGDAIVGSGAEIVLPSDAPGLVDYEGEVAVVVGAGGVIAGFTAANDITARDVQMAGLERFDFTSAKTFPTFKPLGPGLITADEVDRPLRIVTRVNGEIRQEADTDDLIFSFAEVLDAVSAAVELVPSDVILTGSPAGVGMVRQQFLQPGDQIEIVVGDLPPLQNRVARA